MADVGKNAQQSWDGDAAQTIFIVGFSYNDKGDVEVKVGGSLQTRPTQYDFVGTAAQPPTIQFVTAPPSGTLNVVLKRISPHPTPVVTFSNRATIPAADLDKALRQILYYAEEVEDKT